MRKTSRDIRIFMFAAAAAALLLSGCAARDPEPQARGETPRPPMTGLPQEALSGPEASPNSYYFYLEAQFQKRRGNVDAAIASLNSAISKDPGVSYLQKELAVLYLHKQQYEKSLAIIEQMLAENPESVDLLLLKASIQRTLNPDAGVIPIYEKILSLDPEKKDVYQVLGKLYIEAGRLEKAADVFAKLVSRFPGAYAGHFYLGKIHSRLGRYEKAQAAFERTIDLAPSLNQPRWALIDLYQSRGRQEKVVALYEQILEHSPENAAAAIELGLAYKESGKSARAKEVFAELGRRSAEDKSVIRTVVQRLVLNKRYDEALTVLSGMLAGAPEGSGLRYASGIARYKQEQYEQAEKAFQKVSPASEYHGNAVIHRAIIAYQQQQDLEKAIAILEGAVGSAGDEEKIELIPYLSSFYKKKELFGKAEELLLEGLSIEPKNTKLRFELGVLYDEKGAREKAIDQMEQVLEVDPEHADALNYIGYTYADQGIHLEKAEKLIRRALEKKPENGYIIDSLGWLYYRRGRLEEAAACIERAVQLIPNDPVVLEHLGDVYKALGRLEEAMDAYQRALENRTGDRAKIEDKIKALQKNGS
ncbi:MAG TPA: tetratricopeptide repeat protein [Desulfosalsimonadaceae bacterium]|nr:tetratricopeptide repeat protein [Desulfosalsimonadaceae bacterium]